MRSLGDHDQRALSPRQIAISEVGCRELLVQERVSRDDAFRSDGPRFGVHVHQPTMDHLLCRD